MGTEVEILVDGIELNPEINPHIHGQLLFDKDTQSIQWGEIIVMLE